MLPQQQQVILLDLNYTLVENSKSVIRRGEHTGRLFYNVGIEIYRKELVERMKELQAAGSTVVLITVRPDQYREATLDNIKKQTGWAPDMALFAEFPAKAPVAKEHLFKKYVLPAHGCDSDRYFAIESNQDTRAMYARLGIK